MTSTIKWKNEFTAPDSYQMNNVNVNVIRQNEPNQGWDAKGNRQQSKWQTHRSFLATLVDDECVIWPECLRILGECRHGWSYFWNQFGIVCVSQCVSCTAGRLSHQRSPSLALSIIIKCACSVTKQFHT